MPAGLDKLVKPVGDVVHVEIKRRTGAVARGAGSSESSILDLPGAKALVDVLGPEPGQLDLGGRAAPERLRRKRVGPREVARQFRGLGEQKTWDLCDRAFGKDLPGAIRLLRAIEEGGDEAIMVLGGIAARLRDLLRVRTLPDRMPAGEVAKAAGLRLRLAGPSIPAAGEELLGRAARRPARRIAGMPTAL